MEALKQAVRASVRALALEALNSEEWATVSACARYEAMEDVVNEVVAEGLVAIALKYNDKRPALRLPDDVLCRVVADLPLLDRLNATEVCHKWRTVLVRSPDLWTHVSLTLCEDGDLTYLPDALTMLFARSQAKALTVELMLAGLMDDPKSCTFRPYGALGRVAELIKLEMPRMKSLSLCLPDCFDAPWLELLVTPAPKLETFRLIIAWDFWDGDKTLPNNLFAFRAPLLRHAHLDWVWMNNDAYPALGGLTSLFYDHTGALDDDDFPLFLSCNSLRHLTLVDRTPHTLTARLPQPLRLQLWNAVQVEDLVASFPHARHICYSAGLEKEVVDGLGPRDLTAMVDAVSDYPNPVSFEVARRAPLLPEDKEDTTPRLALRINGQDLIVDMLYSVMFDLFTRLPPLPILFHTVRILAVVEELLPSINIQGLPALDDLTIYMTRRDDTAYRTADYLATDDVPIGMQLHTLRLIRSSSEDLQNRTPPRRIGIGPILQFVSVKLLSGSLERLILCGFRVSATEVQLLQSGGVKQVVFDHAPGILGDDDDCGPWRWQFPVEEAHAL